MLPRKEGTFKVIGVDEDTFPIKQDGLVNIVSIHPASLSPMSGLHCDDIRVTEVEILKEKERHSDKNSDEGYNGTENTYVVDKIVLHVSLGSRLRYFVRWQVYCIVVGNSKQLHHLSEHIIKAYLKRFDKKENIMTEVFWTTTALYPTPTSLKTTTLKKETR